MSKTILLAAFVVLCLNYLAAGSLQTLLIRTVDWQQEDSDGKVEAYQGHVKDLSKTSAIIQNGAMKSFCIVGAGLWMYEAYADDGSYKIGYAWRRPFDSESPLPSCSSTLYLDEKYLQMKSIRPGGPSNLTHPAISLYTERAFSFEQGSNNEIYFDGTAFSLASPAVIRSIAFTGSEGWTIYSETNFEGTSACVEPDFGDGIGNVAVVVDMESSVGSVKRGCKNQKLFTPKFPAGGFVGDHITVIAKSN